MGKQQDHVAEAIALMDKSAERTTPNAQTQAWATIRAHIEGLEAQLAECQVRGGRLAADKLTAEARVRELEESLDGKRHETATLSALLEKAEGRVRELEAALGTLCDMIEGYDVPLAIEAQAAFARAAIDAARRE